MAYKDYELGVGETGAEFGVDTRFSILISGLSAGEIKFQIKYRESGVETPVWRDYPSASFTEDVSKILTLYDEAFVRPVGVGNTANVYVRIGKE